MSNVTKIQKRKKVVIRRKRVAAYCRVSSGKDAMLNSLSAQVSYYNSYISSHPEWIYVGIYADEGISGTKVDRPEFLRLITDCRNGKIDIILTKSISRFARNTVALLETIRELRTLGIDVYFEKEHIHTLSSEGEFLITLLATYAQEEARSMSLNQTWSVQKRFEKGIPCNPTIFGYRYKDGKFEIEPEEAKVIQRIFSMHLSGKGRNEIAKVLNTEDIPTRHGGQWDAGNIYKILRNVTYTGNLLLQKTYCVDFLSHKRDINNGVKPKYEVLEAHESIISMDVYQAVQEEISRREAIYATDRDKYLARYPFSGLITCGHCGAKYRRRINNAGSKYESPVWVCDNSFKNGQKVCKAKQVPESILMQKTLELLELDDINAIDLKDIFREIRVPEQGRLVYVFKNGFEHEVSWTKSRKNSWTDGMKQKAREKTLARYRKEATYAESK